MFLDLKKIQKKSSEHIFYKCFKFINMMISLLHKTCYSKDFIFFLHILNTDEPTEKLVSAFSDITMQKHLTTR